MPELDRFEARFAAAYRRYLDEVPTEVDAAEVARAAALQSRARWGRWSWGLRTAPALAWLLLAALVLGALVAGAFAVGSHRPWSPAVPWAAPITDEALASELAAAWSAPYDADRIAALYASDATFDDRITGRTSTGLEAIQAKAQSYASQGFHMTVSSIPIRQGDVLAWTDTHGTGENAVTGFVVVELRDGKIANQWVFVRPPSRPLR